MKTFNLFRGVTSGDESDPPGFQARAAQLGPMLGAARVGMTVYELPPGQAVCPYHFHWGDEEWLIVVAGTPTVRTPEGETVLDAGDVVCFPVGPAGAHRINNAGDETARVALFSNTHEFGIIEYPDSDKVGIWDATTRRSTTSSGAARTSTTGTESASRRSEAQYHLPRTKPPNATSPMSVTISPITRLTKSIMMTPTITTIPPIVTPPYLRSAMRHPSRVRSAGR